MTLQTILPTSTAGNTPYLSWLPQEAQALARPLMTFRRYLHRVPELGWTEYHTAAFIAENLCRWGWHLSLGEDALCRSARMGLPEKSLWQQAATRAAREGVAQKWLQIFADGMTAIRAELHLGPVSTYAPVFVIRVDMDALPIDECTHTHHLPARAGFTSTHVGLMHACGHDGHMSIALGLALLLARHATDFPHPLTVRLLFQPAEEGVRGAQAMIAAGALENAHAVLGLHIGLNATHTGQLVCGAKNFLATTKLDAEFFGHAAHAAKAPQKGHNALLAASAAALGLHGISRHGDGPTHVCAGVLHAGNSRNTIADHALLKLEVRAATSDIHAWIEGEARRILKASALLWNCKEHISVAGKAPAASSDEVLSKRIAHCAAHMPFFQKIIPSCALGASEDFSFFLKHAQQLEAQASYLLLGSALASEHHSTTFDFEERILAPAVELLSRICADIAAKPL